MTKFLPMTIEEMRDSGWTEPDFLIISGDAYVDHPSFGVAIIGRVLESHGFCVAIIAQPNWHNTADFLALRRPRLGVLISGGNLDSMVNHYTAGKKPRSTDAYTPGGEAKKRPDRATIVYSNRVREAFGDIPIILGGIEASLRRFAHYDYWSDKVRRSILIDAQADLLVYGMGERQIVEIARRLDGGEQISGIKDVAGTMFATTSIKDVAGKYVLLPSFDKVRDDKIEHANAARVQYEEHDSIVGNTLVQQHANKYVVQNPPARPLQTEELDRVYSLPYVGAWHPKYDAAGGVPALEEVEFSVAANRGCFGSCTFCALSFHQGRAVTARSEQSIINEVKKMTWKPNFKGYVHDIGGPTANFQVAACAKQEKHGVCKNKACLYPKPCESMVASHKNYLSVLKKVRQIDGVKKVFIRSGIRYDYLLADKSDEFFRELVEHHVSGQLKVAPEHVSDNVLKLMGKPSASVYEKFSKKFYDITKSLGKEQYLVPYLMSSHPGSGLAEAIELALYLKRTNHTPQQVQDFYPTPGTLATAMFYTGLDPRTMESVYVPKNAREKAMQRALLQYKRPENYALVREALIKADRVDLIGFGEGCLIRPSRGGSASNPNREHLNKSNNGQPDRGSKGAQNSRNKRDSEDKHNGDSRKAQNNPYNTGKRGEQQGAAHFAGKRGENQGKTYSDGKRGEKKSQNIKKEFRQDEQPASSRGNKKSNSAFKHIEKQDVKNRSANGKVYSKGSHSNNLRMKNESIKNKKQTKKR